MKRKLVENYEADTPFTPQEAAHSFLHMSGMQMLENIFRHNKDVAGAVALKIADELETPVRGHQRRMVELAQKGDARFVDALVVSLVDEADAGYHDYGMDLPDQVEKFDKVIKKHVTAAIHGHQPPHGRTASEWIENEGSMIKESVGMLKDWGILVEGDVSDLNHILRELGQEFRSLKRNHEELRNFDWDDIEDLFHSYARDEHDHDASDELSAVIGDFEEAADESGAHDIASFHKKMEKLHSDIEDGEFSDEDDIDDEVEVDGRVYTVPEVVRFVNDMEGHGHEVEHYRGRFHWEGPAVVTDEDPRSLQKLTKTKLQWDQMGLGSVVYPVKRDPGKKKS